jgi:hypothetical protein
MGTICRACGGAHVRPLLGVTLAVGGCVSPGRLQEGPPAAIATPDLRGLAVWEPCGELYRVEAGDTWWRLAQLSGEEAAALARANGLSLHEVLRAGQYVRLSKKPQVRGAARGGRHAALDDR